MKLIIPFFLFFLTLGNVNAQMRVKDKNKINQIKSIEYKQWEFSPDWYYYSWVKRKIFGISIRVPGLGRHDRGPGGIGIGGDNYVNEYDNNVKQYTPMIATVSSITLPNTEQQEEDTETVYKQELAKFADKTIDYAYILSKSRRDELKGKFNILYQKYALKNGSSKEGQNNMYVLKFEYDRIISNVEIIKDSHMSNAIKREAYLQNEQELIELVALTQRLIRLSDVLK